MERRPCEEAPVGLSDDMVAEILLRLQTHSVLRLAAVCKQWRRVTADPFFHAARARRAPPLRLLRVTRPRPCGTHDEAELSLRVVVPAPPSDGAATPRRLLARYTASFSSPSRDPHCDFLACCDDLLLFKKHPQELYLICNPTTRRWSLLPRLTPQLCGSSSAALGFYLHRPSGEYRVLCKGSADSSPRGSSSCAYYVLAAGGSESRRLDATTRFLPTGRRYHLGHVDVGDKLYWIDLMEIGGRGGRLPYPYDSSPRKIMAFDTVSETFRLVAPPPEPMRNNDDVLMFVLDGALALLKLEKTATSPEWTLKLWVLLEDAGGGERWACRHQVKVEQPLAMARCFSAFRSAPAVGVAAWEDGGGGLAAGKGRTAVACAQRRITLYGVDMAAARALHIFACGGGDCGAFDSREVQVAFSKNTVAHAFFKTHPSSGVRTFGFL